MHRIEGDKTNIQRETDDVRMLHDELVRGKVSSDRYH